MRCKSIALAAVLAACLPLAASASVVTLLDNQTKVASRTSPIGYRTDYFYGTDIPSSTQISISSPPGSSQDQIDYFQQNGQTVFSNVFSGTRDGSGGSLAGTQGEMIFSVSQDTTYLLSGWFAVHDNGVAGAVELRGELYDMDTSLPDYMLFWNEQSSKRTTDERLELGEQGGDEAGGGILQGSLQGTLRAGHTYRYLFVANSGANIHDDDGASSEGQVILMIGSPTGLPEPGSLPLLLAAGLALGLSRIPARR